MLGQDRKIFIEPSQEEKVPLAGAVCTRGEGRLQGSSTNGKFHSATLTPKGEGSRGGNFVRGGRREVRGKKRG